MMVPISASISRHRLSSRLLCRAGLLGVLVFGVCSCQSQERAASDRPATSVEMGGSEGAQAVESFETVDCRIPGRLRRLSGGMTVMGPPRLISTTYRACTHQKGLALVSDPARWMRAAEEGDAEAQTKVGDLQEEAGNYAEAAIWYARAADQNYPPAQVELGRLYSEGLGVKQDSEKAMDFVSAGTGLSGDILMKSAVFENDGDIDGELIHDLDVDAETLAEAGQILRDIETRQADLDAKLEEFAQKEAELKRLLQDLEDKRAEIKAQNVSEADIAELGKDVEELEDDVTKLAEDSQDIENEIVTDQAELEARQEEFSAYRESVPDFGTYHALVIGNSAHPGLKDGTLDTAIADAEEIAKALEVRYGYKVQMVHDAGRDDLIKAINYFKRLGPSDNLLVYYAGHGEWEDGEGYWLPSDIEEDRTQRISVGVITSTLKSLNAKHVLVVADSCYAKSLIENPKAPNIGLAGPVRPEWYRYFAKEPVRMALASGGLQPVLDGEDGLHSVFAAAFLDRLNRNQELMHGAWLFWSVATRVRAKAKKLDIEQEPAYSSIDADNYSGGDYFFMPINGG